MKKQPTGLLGISLGKQHFHDTQNMKRYIEYMNTYFEQGYFLIADHPKRHNLVALEGITYPEADSRMEKQSIDYENFLRKLTDPHPDLHILSFEEYVLADAYQWNLLLLQTAFAQGDAKDPHSFRSHVEMAVDQFLEQFYVHDQPLDPDRPPKDFARDISKEYVLEEMALLEGIQTLLPAPLTEIYPGKAWLQESLHHGRYHQLVNLAKGSPSVWLSKGLIRDPRAQLHEVYADKRDIYVRDNPLIGKTLYANRPYERGDLLFNIEGPIVQDPNIYTIPISRELFINPVGLGKRLNHSCEPSAGIQNRSQVVAFRDIHPGEEITIDYAMIVDSYDQPRLQQDLRCSCLAKTCRGELGSYRRLSPEKKEEYDGFISEYLLES